MISLSNISQTKVYLGKISLMKLIPRSATTAVVAALMLVGTTYFALGQATGAEQQPQDQLWQTECTGQARDSEALHCVAFQNLFVAQSRHILFSIRILVPTAAADPILRLTGPLNIYLPAGYELNVDGSPFAKLEVASCSKAGCAGAIQLTPDQVDRLKRGRALNIAFSATRGQVTTVETPLTGFTRAINAIR